MRTDYVPAVFRRALAREALAYVAHGAIFGLGYLPSRHRPVRARDIRTLVFVHGLAANRAGFLPLQLYLRAAGYARQYAFNFEAGGSIESMALELRRRLHRDVRGGRIDLIGHSLGGLVARYYVQLLGGHRRVDRLITLATPHQGSHPAVYVPSPLFWQLRPAGAFIDHLDRQPWPERVRLVSMTAAQDHLVVPAQHASAPFGASRVFPRLGHLSMLLSPRVFAAVLEELEAGAPRRNE